MYVCRDILTFPKPNIWSFQVETPFIELGQLSTALYFSYFVLIVPTISLIENTLVDLSFGGIKNTK